MLGVLTPPIDSSTKSSSPPTEIKETKKREITLEEVSKHKSENDCWVVVNGQVLDVTNFLPDHPGLLI